MRFESHGHGGACFKCSKQLGRAWRSLGPRPVQKDLEIPAAQAEALRLAGGVHNGHHLGLEM